MTLRSQRGKINKIKSGGAYMGFYYYSALTAKKHLSKTVMTTAQREQLHKNYKKYVIYRFKNKPDSVVYDGGGFFSDRKLRTMFHVWMESDIFQSSGIAKKSVPFWEYSSEDKDKIAKKTAVELRKAGYKVEVLDNGGLSVYKTPTKK